VSTTDSSLDGVTTFIEYEVISEPPSEGADQESNTSPSPTSPERSPGTSGAVSPFG